MPFAIPKNVPSFDDPQRSLEDRAWASIPGRAVTRANGYFGHEKTLPMYKDKPYHYDPSQKERRWFSKKRVWGVAVLIFTFFLWLSGYFEKKPGAGGLRSSWKWVGSDYNSVDWDQRRESVVEAFKLSWDSYAQNGWGKVISSLLLRT